jgi:hypothetical protein
MINHEKFGVYSVHRRGFQVGVIYDPQALKSGGHNVDFGSQIFFKNQA